MVVEGNHYFPPDAVRRQHVEPSDERSTCPWKGVASYYDVIGDGDRNRASAWYYAQPKDAAAEIAGRVAFCAWDHRGGGRHSWTVASAMLYAAMNEANSGTPCSTTPLRAMDANCDYRPGLTSSAL